MSKGSKKKPKEGQSDRSTEPNAETRAAMEELESGQGKRVATVEELMKELNSED